MHSLLFAYLIEDIRFIYCTIGCKWADEEIDLMPIGGLQELKSGLRTAAGIDNDVLLAALKRSPATAPLAAARTQELITNLLSSEYGSQVNSEHCSISYFTVLQFVYTIALPCFD